MNASQIGAKLGGEQAVGKGWRAFFWAATFFNFAIGLATMLSPESTVDVRIVGLLVFCMGLIYLLVARDPARFSPVLWAGVIGKIGAVALLGPQAFGQGGEPLVASALVLDGIFALGFLSFLLTRSDGR